MAIWNEKKTMIWGFFVLSFGLPVVAMVFATLFPFMHRHPILFWILAGISFVVGLVIVCRWAGRKDENE